MRSSRGAVLVAVASVGLLLAGCGGKSGESGNSDDPATETGTIRVLVANFPADNEGKTVFKGIVDIFHKTYPKIKVESTSFRTTASTRRSRPLWPPARTTTSSAPVSGGFSRLPTSVRSRA